MTEIEENFVFRGNDAADKWDAEGAIPSVHNTMIHILSDEDMITVVVDERNPAMEELVEAIKSGLCDDIFHFFAELEAA